MDSFASVRSVVDVEDLGNLEENLEQVAYSQMLLVQQADTDSS